MKKAFFIFNLFLLIICFSSPPFALAQSNVQVEKIVKCLTNRPEDPGNARSLTWHDPPSPQSIPKYLKGVFAQGSTVYAVACIGSGTGRVCGTGSAKYDDELFGATPVGITRGTARINVSFYHTDDHKTPNPKFEVDASQEIKVDATVGGTTASSGAYEFFGVEVRPSAGLTTGGVGGLQQSVFKFESLTGKDCATISWTHHDPYGIVFDSVSLEPLPNVVVTIRDQAGTPLVNNPVLKNNAKTQQDGVFNYLVPPGKYILTVQPPAGYQFSATPHASPNMTQVYDFIDDNDTKNHCTIYKPGEIIDEKADMPECRNIPLDPVSVSPSVKDPVSMQYSFEKKENEGIYVIKGKASHPLTTVVAFQNVTGQGQKVELGRIEANHSGFYTLEIPISKVLADSAIEVQFVKSSLLGIPPQAHFILPNVLKSVFEMFSVKNVSAQTSTSLSLDPLPAYVEGYAYDENRQAIPNAVVQVKLKNDDTVYFETTADKNGYFYIAPKNLPASPINLEFYLNFVTSNGANVKYRIFEFTQANKYFFTKENINLLTGKKNGVDAAPQDPGETLLNVVPIKNTINKPAQQKNQTATGAVSPNEGKKDETQGPITKQIVIIALLVVVLGVVGTVAALTIFKKKPALPQY